MKPQVSFVIGGVQKGGTTALARFIARHPDIALPTGKEAHVFDAPDFDDNWGVDEVNERYRPHFAGDADVRIRGDATPIYCFHPALVVRIAKYNPDMRWILILRHPVERVVSQYQMEHSRGFERWPFWPALVLERWRLRGHRDDFSNRSPLRHFSYRARSDYAAQLDVLYQHFPQDQVLVLKNDVLAEDPVGTLAGIRQFLALPPGQVNADDFGRVFEGRYRRIKRSNWRFKLLSWLLRAELCSARRRYGINWG